MIKRNPDIILWNLIGKNKPKAFKYYYAKSIKQTRKVTKIQNGEGK